MKLSEALMERKTAQKKISELSQRMQRVAFIEEGQTPPEDPLELLEELNVVATRLERLIVQINQTNMQHATANGEPIMAALARRDVMMIRLNVLDNMLQACSNRQYRSRGGEIRFVSTISQSDLQLSRDQLAKEYRELDLVIQAANWAVDLVE